MKKAIALSVGALLIVGGGFLFFTPLPLGLVSILIGIYVLATQFKAAEEGVRWVHENTGPVGRGMESISETVSERFDEITESMDS